MYSYISSNFSDLFPQRELLLDIHRCMRRTGGRQSDRWDTSHRSRQTRENISPITLLCHGAVEEDAANVLMRRKKMLEIIRNDGGTDDIRIETTLADTGIQYVPYCNFVILQLFAPILVRELPVDAVNGFNEAPESITRVGVVLVCAQRSFSGH